MKILRICQHTFVQNFLGPKPLVLDCGVNIGEFSTYMSQNYDARIYGFEPDPRLFSNLPSLSKVKFFPVAVTGTGAPFRLMLGESHCSSGYFCEKTNQPAIMVESITLRDIIQNNEIKSIDLIKLDIEGAEIDVLLQSPDELLLRAGQITIEFHDFLLKNQLVLIQQVIRKLTRLGFYYARMSYSDHSDTLFINTKQYKITIYHRTLFLLHKYISGLCRLVIKRR